MTSRTVRPAAVAGLFYPGDAATLRAQIAGLLGAAGTPARDAAPKILLAPHAGYVYSGAVAAEAYATLGAAARERIRRVVLLGPSHRVALRGLAAPTVEAFETPLGRIAIDRAALDSLADLPQVVARDDAHASEHALEVQLPFLQTVLADFRLVPLVVGHATPEAVAEVIARLWGGEETLIVISSDLSHYLPYARAQAADRATIDAVLRLDPALDHEQACGATPLAGALLAARAHGLAPRLLALCNSGDTAGDRARVVGYAAVAFERNDPLADPLGEALLARARNAIADALGQPTGPEPGHAALAEPGATFVTLRRDGELRGCVGTLAPQRALEHDVRLHALAAAFHDHRFTPLAAWEFQTLAIEVSLIGPSEPIAAASEDEALNAIEPGVDGVTLEYRGRHATFLPQVWEQLPAPADFLAALKRKAGLPEDFWAEALRLSRYRVRKFGQA
ncbi:MAG: AmmeMemoRadiSam system protein B [Piscinibacter sp.]|uniref:AmmeMemoRadiSam system protein B n=2 Tax=Piscinibacter sp. TaxID=1903157 RepID=UPI001B5610B9|nr:AmmeMemoRadiSam system protein B [Piscinibacter sp.]MBP5989902.1 AmmeMemoRadiSam system protein B [Piscinibacter sp.]MBP6026713.1 AmmeMemoRadiSam system protein B [Piscinibacter sp.]